MLTKMTAQHCSVTSDDRTRLLAQFTMASEEPRPIGTCQEAEILRIRLGGDGQPGLGGVPAAGSAASMYV